MAVNHLVVGSNPTAGAIFDIYNGFLKLSGVALPPTARLWWTGGAMSRQINLTISSPGSSEDRASDF